MVKLNNVDFLCGSGRGDTSVLQYTSNTVQVSQLNPESDLSLRGPESTVWCTMVPTSGSLHRYDATVCFLFPREGDENEEVHGQSMDTLIRWTYLTSTRANLSERCNFRLKIYPEIK